MAGLAPNNPPPVVLLEPKAFDEFEPKRLFEVLLLLLFEPNNPPEAPVLFVWPNGELLAPNDEPKPPPELLLFVEPNNPPELLLLLLLLLVLPKRPPPVVALLEPNKLLEAVLLFAPKPKPEPVPVPVVLVAPNPPVAPALPLPYLLFSM